jgi:hypothetical protein
MKIQHLLLAGAGLYLLKKRKEATATTLTPTIPSSLPPPTNPEAEVQLMPVLPLSMTPPLGAPVVKPTDMILPMPETRIYGLPVVDTVTSGGGDPIVGADGTIYYPQ